MPLQDLHDRLPKKLYWQGRHFRLLYNRQLDTSTSYEPDWEHGPATRPDYTIERTEPLEIRHAGELIWREPPVVLDAKYYLASHNSKESDARQIWQIFERQVTRSGSDFAAFETWAHTMCTEHIREKRNTLAHGETVTREVAASLRTFVRGNLAHPGILCWLAQHLDPADP